MKEYPLAVELVPRALWGMSLAKQYQPQWNRLRIVTYARAGHKCEICGGTGKRGSAVNPGGLEAHEIWEYLIGGQNATQRLVRLTALCPMCHRCKHMGRSYKVMTPEVFQEIKAHFMRVNGMQYPEEFDEYYAQAREQWQYHNALNWSQDISALIKSDPAYAYRKLPLIEGGISVKDIPAGISDHIVDQTRVPFMSRLLRRKPG